MPYAIVIDVPSARNGCYVAIPFTVSFQPLEDHITAAAADLGLQRVRVRSGQMETGVDFVDDICEGIRSARLVVAVCHPDPRTHDTNANVAYELGYAHALGKPTLILTGNPPSLPANVQSKHAIVCDEAELGTPTLTLRIRDAMRAVISRSGEANPLTDPAYTNIRTVVGRNPIFYDRQFWDQFRDILSFAKLVHDEHQHLVAAASDPFFEQAAEMMSNPRQSHRMVGVIKAWRSYEGHFQNLTQPAVYTSLDRRLKAVDEAFNYLDAQAGSELRPDIDDCFGFYQALRERLREYPKLVGDTAGLVPDPRTPVQHREVAQQLFLQADKLRQATRTIAIHSGRLIFNLIELIQKAGK